VFDENNNNDAADNVSRSTEESDESFSNSDVGEDVACESDEASPVEGHVIEEPADPVLDEAAQRELEERRAHLPWYAVHTYSGYEMRAKMSLEERVKLHKLERKFGSVLVPQETVVELVRGQKKTSTRKFFPGYILVQVDLDDETWHLVAETPKITGFVGDSRNPSPLTKEEVETLTRQMEGGASRPRPRVQFEEGDAVKVIDGPFAEFNGTVDEVKPDKGKLRVLISIFGRNTPVELDFVQVEKA
jgi:transcription termination/antitermination protein NusG